MKLTDTADNETLQTILDSGLSIKLPSKANDDTVSSQIINSYKLISEQLSEDLADDPFKRLGKWTEFITHKLYFAVFVHPDPATAYQVFEVINTRGRDLTTADLLKNYVISQTAPGERGAAYERWKHVSSHFPSDGASSFVQYIRHVITVDSGHILPKDLFAFLAGKISSSRRAPTANQLLDLLENRLPLYMQIVDQSAAGPASSDHLRIFAALKRLNVITVRPLIMAISELQSSQEGLNFLLRLVVRRIIVGNLGTGNVERKLADAARKVATIKDWEVLQHDLEDLNPDRDSFISQLKKRSFNKGTLSFVRNSIISKTISPDYYYPLHFILPRTTTMWSGFNEDERAYWGSTVGNTFLAKIEQRPDDAVSWDGFKQTMLSKAAPGEWVEKLEQANEWNADVVKEFGDELAQAAGEIWYD